MEMKPCPLESQWRPGLERDIFHPEIFRPWVLNPSSAFTSCAALPSQCLSFLICKMDTGSRTLSS